MTNKIEIIGAGMAGLLAGNMLRRDDVRLFEAQPELPNNHHGVLRFRSKAVQDATGIPFREVKVLKGVDEQDSLKAAMEYSAKVTGEYALRSVLNLEPSTRYIAPENFIRDMADGVSITYSHKYNFETPIDDIVRISTIPMSALMDALMYDGPRPEFRFRKGWSFKALIKDCDVFATRYYASPMVPFYRTSITGNVLTVEFAGERDHSTAAHSTDPNDELLVRAWIGSILEDFGINRDNVLQVLPAQDAHYAKIVELTGSDREAADEFMHWATNEHNIYSLGRFATWRSGLLMDDVVQDVQRIARWIEGGNYQRKKESN